MPSHPPRRTPYPRKTTTRRNSAKRQTPDASTRKLAYIVGFAVVCLVAWLVATAKSPDRHTNATDQNIGPRALEQVITNPDAPEQLIEYSGMTVSFNPSTHQPNWVAWELLASETEGLHARENQFAVDPDIKGCATPADYTGSGFDRGHMAPAGDMKWSRQSMRESFLMTNICPQAGPLNRGSWKKLEEKCRQIAVADSAIIIVCGPIFQKGEANERIGQTGVAVPRQFFKVILSPYSDPPTAIGFIMPNGQVNGGMQKCAVSVDSVEALTGHNFFTALPDDIEAAVESRCDFHRWSTRAARHRIK